MFTGIVRELGRVAAFDGARLQIESPLAAAQAAIGDSIAIAGVCLTVVANDDGATLAFDTVPESWNNVMPQLVIAGISFQ